MSNALQLTSQCNKINVPVLNQPQLLYLLTELSPGAAMAQTRMPLNFALVLDRSGSMAGAKLHTMKEAVKNIIDQLEPSDVISIVMFDSSVQTLVPAQAASDKHGLKRKVDSIDDGGATNMAPALREGLSQVGHNYTPDRISRIVLLTDGEVTDEESASFAEADRAGSMGIPVIGLGFGDNWKHEFMIALTDRSVLAAPGSETGKADYIKTPNDAVRVFQEVYQSMQVVAQGVTLTYRLVQGIEARRVWQVTPMIRDVGLSSIQGRAIVVQVGDLEKTGMSYLVEMMCPPRPAGNVRLAQAEVKYNVPGQGMQTQAIDMVVSFTADPALANQANGHVMNVVERVTAFKLQTQALDEAQMGKVGNATQKLRQAVTILLNQGETELANQLQQEVNNLQQGQGISDKGKKTIKLESRKTVRL
jgi:Ca-activated chloride channel family protein